MGRKRKMWMFIAIASVSIIIAISIVLPPSFGRVAPIADGHGNVIKGSIAEKTYVKINDLEQGMFIKGTDQTKPVLLLLHGGPGLSDYFMSKDYPTGLEEQFVVCYWEQRGTGLSYSKDMNPNTMNTKQFIDDTIAVTNYLRERFGQEKIYLMGHSWGSYLGLQVAAQSPELFHAYIAMSQVVYQNQSEKIAYEYMLQRYKETQNAKMIEKFEAYPIHESEQAMKEYRGSLLRDEAMHELGIGTMHSMKSVISGIFFPTLRCTDYTPMERLNIWRGKAFSRASGLQDELFSFDAITQVPRLEIPVYFFSGFYDLTCSYSLQKEYYNRIQAPVKGFYTFYESAHSPLFEEPGKAIEILSSDVLKGKNNLTDSE
jgi:pimeloyl-ACP methyl ester carboxylesterase